jgi:hypothetical protein
MESTGLNILLFWTSETAVYRTQIKEQQLGECVEFAVTEDIRILSISKSSHVTRIIIRLDCASGNIVIKTCTDKIVRDI